MRTPHMLGYASCATNTNSEKLDPPEISCLYTNGFWVIFDLNWVPLKIHYSLHPYNIPQQCKFILIILIPLDQSIPTASKGYRESKHIFLIKDSPWSSGIGRISPWIHINLNIELSPLEDGSTHQLPYFQSNIYPSQIWISF